MEISHQIYSLSFELQTWVLGTAHRLNVIHSYFKIHPLMTSLWTGQAVLSHDPEMCLWPSLHTVSWWRTFVPNYMYIKFLHLMNELWTRQAVLSYLTLKCFLDHWISHTDLAICCLMMVNIYVKFCK